MSQNNPIKTFYYLLLHDFFFCQFLHTKTIGKISRNVKNIHLYQNLEVQVVYLMSSVQFKILH
jgi:hypothetical protein